MLNRSSLLRCLSFACSLTLPAIALSDDPASLTNFEKHVRPLLIRHCYECHSQQAKRLEGGLFLDSRAGHLRGGDSGAAIVPGAPDESLLIDAVNYGNYEMPPRGKLSDQEIAILVDWVKAGAVWPEEAAPMPLAGTFDWKQRRDEHWSWQPLQNRIPPTVEGSAWPRGPIDQFILSRLREHELTPAPASEKATWLRRVSFDLIGLPPTPEEISAYLSDTGPDPEAKVVDALLASPQFGEKWARHWMDLVRYAETHGHEFDFPIHHAARYRDYLIRAFNADVPYDQLIREHVAGDLVSSPRLHPVDGTNESVIGTGFWFLGEAVHAPTDVRADLSTRIENQIDVFSRAFLGLSVACARCHDHKFDAISKEDYYALYGILNSSRRQISWLDSQGEIEAAVQELEKSRELVHGALRESLADDSLNEPGVISRYLNAAGSLRASPNSSRADSERLAKQLQLDHELLLRWVTALEDTELENQQHPVHVWRQLNDIPESGFAAARNQLREQLDRTQLQARESRATAVQLNGSPESKWTGWMSSGPAFRFQTGSLALDPQGDEISILMPGTAHSGTVSPRLRGAVRSPTFILTHPHVHTRLNAKNATLRVIIENYFMDEFQPLLFGDAIRKNVDTKGRFGWITQSGDLKDYLGRRAHLEILDEGDGYAAVDEIWMSDGAPPVDPPSKISLEIARDEQITSRESLAASCEQTWRQALHDAAEGRVDSHSTQLLNWMLRHRLLETGSRLRTARAALLTRADEVPSPIGVLSISEGDGLDEPVHIRGSDSNFGPEVARRFLLAISGEEQSPIKQGSGRKELAERITDPQNPFLSRVIVNRLWHHLFGRGIVPTVDDFGVMGTPPSHPELLDWLALDFDRHGRSLKHTIREIVLSQTYRMSSRPTDAAAEEKDPDNVWLHRMPLRRLPAESLRDSILAVSGRLDATMSGPSVPVHLTPFMQGRGQPGSSGPLDGNGRRSVYQEVRRNFLAPFLLAFDMPSPFSCMGRRAVSNVPSQSLIFMNDPFVVEQARLWARQSIAEESDADSRIQRLFLQAYGHPPDSAELKTVHEFLKQQAAAPGDPPNEEQVWTDLCHLLLNRKEFLFIQ
ncbi:PSD1 and planctomycete cytochrome C domain-containing protein [Planctomicrobium sp. SH661]|uniref:PSD1 and planctomycete cytochrome C domain-containing protein n=1 Tax=Planctomicrobium sp. SH661 TaxID=3448124 RepID=UPI003F5B0D1C